MGPKGIQRFAGLGLKTATAGVCGIAEAGWLALLVHKKNNLLSRSSPYCTRKSIGEKGYKKQRGGENAFMMFSN